MTQISLSDDLVFDFSGNRMRVLCSHPLVPEDDTNLAWRAARIFYDNLPARQAEHHAPLTLTITKNIPVGGGLGGGSSNAACVLKTLNRVHDDVFSLEQLMKFGLELGADVPFFLLDAPAVATGIGERLEICRTLGRYFAVICDPGIEASTREVYKKFDFRLTKIQNCNIRDSLNICSREQGAEICELLHNDLEEPACCLYPEIGAAKKKMERLLGRRVFMTGSGAALFALYPDHGTARRALKSLEAEWEGKPAVFLTSFR